MRIDISSVQGTDSTELMSYVYNLELNDGNVSTLTSNDKLNIVDNNTGTYEEQRNEGVLILLSEPQAISEPCDITGKKIKLTNVVNCYSIALPHTGPDQKEDSFDTLMYKLLNVGISDARIFNIIVQGCFTNVNL